jgi:hypothetical protein
MIAVLILSAVLEPILNGITLSILWGWFVVPAFDVPALALVPAIGICFIVSFLGGYNAKTAELIEQGKLGLAKALVRSVVWSVFFLGSGLVLSWFM